MNPAYDFKSKLMLRGNLMNSKKMMGPMFQNQVRMHAWHLIINHCIYVFWIVTGGDLNTFRQIGDEERIIELILEQQEEKIIIFKPCHQEERHRAIGKRESPEGILLFQLRRKGNRQMGFQVVGDRQKGSRILLFGGRQMGPHVSFE